MALGAKIEGNGVVIYQSPGNQRMRKITGWPDAEKATSAVVTEGTCTVSFSNGKVRMYDPEDGTLLGTF